MLDPNLGVVLQAYTGLEPVTYKVRFFDGEKSGRTMYGEEDLIRLTERERDLFLKQYPEVTREEILRDSRRSGDPLKK
jgi:hypothetical protein